MALKHILRKLYRRLFTRFIFLSINIGTGSCAHGNAPLGFTYIWGGGIWL